MLDELREEMLAEQAERIARLELRNEIWFIGLIVWGALLLGWLIFCSARLLREMKRSAAVQSGTLTFTCETCGSMFEVSASYLANHPFTSKKMVRAGAGGIEGTVRLSRRLACPTCGKKTWCRQDMGETGQIAGSILREVMGGNILKFLIGAAILAAAGGVFFAVLNIAF